VAGVHDREELEVFIRFLEGRDDLGSRCRIHVGIELADDEQQFPRELGGLGDLEVLDGEVLGVDRFVAGCAE
jgi:hypothetical protein